MQNCYFPAVHVDEKKENEDVKMVDLIKNNIRFDKIRNSKDQLRGAFMKVDVVSGASGSAYVEFNRTRVICAVYGPRNDTRSRKEFSHEGQLVCDFKYAPFADITGRRERGQVGLCIKIFSSYP
jgi:exosome complex component MTR3